MPSLSRSAITALALLAAVVLAILFLGQCQSTKTAKKQAEVAEGQGGAAIGAGEEAGNVTANVAASDAETDALVGLGQAEIAAASQGSKGLAAKRAACRLRTYRDTPQCKEFVK